MSNPPQPQRKVLIVDDTPDVVQFLVARLRAANYETVVAYSGLEGLEKAKDEVPDLILLDVMMPELNGFQVCRKLKEDKRLAHIPVIFLTAKTQPSDRFWAQEVGAAGYLTKPVNPREVVAEVNEILA